MQGKIIKTAVDALKPGDVLADTDIKGFVARCLPSGRVQYGFRYRNAAGRQRWHAVGLHGNITPDGARQLAKKRAGEVADQRDPVQERADAHKTSSNTVDAVLDQFLARHVRGDKPLRSADEIERAFKVYVRPRIGVKSIYELARSDVVKMLDEVEDAHGPVMADRALAFVRKAFTWQAARDDKFTPPIVKGMARTKPRERMRDRTLDDQEICDLFAALDELLAEQSISVYGAAFVRLLLYTAARRGNVGAIAAGEIDAEDWIIPAEKFKGKRKHLVPLSAAARALLPRVNHDGFLLSSDFGESPLRGYSKLKRAIDKKITEIRKRQGRAAMPHWTFHDLRRTARSLLSRAGVPADIGDRVLGHAIAGVRAAYDHHAYLVEKRDALERLAVLVERILRPAEAVASFPRMPGRRPWTRTD
jgi:integrase